MTTREESANCEANNFKKTVKPALSPTKAAEFRKCPLKFRLKNVDGMVEPPGLARERGTLVHSVLEHLFDLPPEQRQLEAALDLVTPRWQVQKQGNPAISELFEDTDQEKSFLEEIYQFIQNYFRLEIPSNLQPLAREQFLEAVTDTGIRLRGIVDRLDSTPTGDLRVIDYKTGKTPSPRFSDDYIFQMKFYALMFWLRDGVLPRRLQLLFLKDANSLHIDPTATQIKEFAQRVEDEWSQIERAAQAQNFPPQPSRLCDWCLFHEYCPAQGGTAPDISDSGLRTLLEIRQNPGA